MNAATRPEFQCAHLYERHGFAPQFLNMEKLLT
jgi:hypothetical protein